LTSKIHAAVDGDGKALNFIITDGSVSDCTQAKGLLEPIIHKDALILGDRAFDTDKILDYIASNTKHLLEIDIFQSLTVFP